MEVNGKIFPVECLTLWYKLLWLTYLDEHPELVEYARQFDDFCDSFEKGTVNNQADIIRKYVKEGREKLLEEIADFQKQL